MNFEITGFFLEKGFVLLV